MEGLLLGDDLHPQDRVAPILGFMSASLIASMSPRCAPITILATLLVSIAASTLLTGALLFLLGRFRLANLTRYIPYPVVGGFLAGSGWLLVIGSIKAATGDPVRMDTLIPLLRRSTTADSSCAQFARFKSAKGRTRCGELSTHLLDLRGLLIETRYELRHRRLEVFPLLSHR